MPLTSEDPSSDHSSNRDPRPAKGAADTPEADQQLVRGLNPQQREAVLYSGQSLLIVAGAGSGKTRVLTHRIAHLIATHRAWPSQILAITFTNKAANEMRERVGQLLGGAAEGMWISTFHSACVRILRREISELGYNSSFTIYDTHDSRVLLKRLIKERHADTDGLTPAAAQHRISQLKNELRDADDLSRDSGSRSPVDEALIDVFRAYDQALLRANALDFDDILVQTVHLFEAFPEVRRRYQHKFRHVLVDEYQDTNKAQYELIRLLTTSADGAGPATAPRRSEPRILAVDGSTATEQTGVRQSSEAVASFGGPQHVDVPTLTVVGDSDQSIYAFRGADMRNIVDFEKDFPGTHVVLLEQNYRSTQRILSAANAVIGNNFDRAEKNLWSALGEGEKITAYAGYTAHDEAQFVADRIDDLHLDGLDYRDIAVFYRTNAQTRALEEIFVRAGIPYRLIGGTKFYDRAEVKDALAYLVAIANPVDELSVRRILNVPKRGIGPTTEQRLMMFAEQQRIDLPTALTRAEEIGLGPKVTQAMSALGGAIVEARTALAEDRLDEVVGRFFEHIGIIEVLRSSLDAQDQARAENLEEFLAQLTDYVDKHPDASMVDFLTEVQLTAAADDLDDESGTVSLMTLHTAKGLEYPAVFITGLEEGLLPHQMSIDEIGGLAEERRLFYVGITRARRRLFLSLAINRTVFGQTRDQLPSRFLDEIPSELIDWRQHPDEIGANRRGISWGGSQRASDDDDFETGGGWGGARSRDVRPKRSGATHAWANEIGVGSTPKTELHLAAGDRIRHKSFGEGTVEELTGRGAKQVAAVRFDSGQRKKLVVALAPIEAL
ncbi:ATP-dependent helicase [Pseudoclavibacter sp. CFCC 13611]|uniref:ATP-dependent helicase n=1 Tax=Pseudoclavibacter sp. CFCC 13611 TaxID=2615178 RepID=UPI0013016378|nr:UvrD-helicase domain-containing protein [Pseudoclavibacter sp. CFCC 13611]KAB1663149.1 AAA family ATPase [Pseudoclavibacter sp. CFCC 13611]